MKFHINLVRNINSIGMNNMKINNYCTFTIMLLILEFVVGLIFLEWCFISLYRYILKKEHIPFRTYCNKRLPDSL